jgi:hypothetical protein
MHTNEKSDDRNSGPLDPLSRARALFADQGLPFPPLPRRLQGSLRQTAEHTFASRDALAPLYSLGAHLAPIQQGAMAEYVALGFDGHGIDSWAVHFYLVAGPIALFLQCRWGNVNDDPVRARERIEGVFGLATQLIQDVEQAEREGKLCKGQRLLIRFSDFVPSGWKWTDDSVWHEDEDLTFLSAMGAVGELSAA